MYQGTDYWESLTGSTGSWRASRSGTSGWRSSAAWASPSFRRLASPSSPATLWCRCVQQTGSEWPRLMCRAGPSPIWRQRSPREHVASAGSATPEWFPGPQTLFKPLKLSTLCYAHAAHRQHWLLPGNVSFPGAVDAGTQTRPLKKVRKCVRKTTYGGKAAINLFRKKLFTFK